MIKSKIILSFSILFITNNLFSQTIITGLIFNIKQQAIEGLNIVLTKPNQTQIIAFAISDIRGAFQLKCSSTFDSILIKVTALGYAAQSVTVSNKTQTVNFTLVEKITALPTVTVKQQPISVEGDTTKYNVASFSSKQDRVIGDIIAKLPGIEIDANGQIKYNGKAISNYYIEGLDLLESKYNMANQNIPYNLVDQVQILNNHQPIKLFDSLNTSTSPALNIKLNKKAKNKLITKVKLGAGVTPLLWDNEITPLRFNTKYQLITSYKSNNTGSALSNELSNNISIKKVGESADPNIKENILNTIPIPNPSISENRYLFNNTHLAHINILSVLKSKAQLKFNCSYLNDSKNLTRSTNTTFFLPNNSFTLIENQNVNIFNNQFNTSFDYCINKEKFFLKNTLKIKVDYAKENNLTKDTANIIQNLVSPFYEYSNNFVLHIPIRKKIYSISSIVNYNKTPQILQVVPGQFLSIFNQLLPYEKTTQYASLNNFNTNNSVAFLSKIGKLQQQVKIGTEYIAKTITSSTEKIVNQSVYQLSDSFKNKIYWQNLRLYAEAKSVFQKKQNQLEVTMPIELNMLQIKNKIVHTNNKSAKLFFNPKVALSLLIKPTLHLELLYSKLNTIGSPTQITQGLILNNYRSINQNDTLLPRQKQNIYSVSLFYKNPLKALFGYVSFAYTNTNKNLIYTQSFNSYYTKTVSLQFDNNQNSILFTSRLSKYIIPAKTTIAFTYYYNYIQFSQFLQNKLVNVNTVSNNFQLKLNYAKSSWVNAESNSILNISKSGISSNLYSTTTLPNYHFEQNLKIYCFLTNRTVLYFNNNFFKITNKPVINKNYLFSDVGIKLKFKKSDAEIICANLLNTKAYTSIVLFNNLQQTITQEIRPLNFMIKYYFNF